jgi:hypothetical protein
MPIVVQSVVLERNVLGEKKYTAKIRYELAGAARTATVHFGQRGYEDFTTHKDAKRWKNYCERHRTRENWAISGVLTAGWWSRWLLWNRPDFQESLRDCERRIGVKIKMRQ